MAKNREEFEELELEEEDMIEDDDDELENDETDEDGADEEADEDEDDETDEPEESKQKPKLYTAEQVSKRVQRRVNAKNAKIAALQEDSELVEELCELAGLDKQTLKARLSAMPTETKAKLMRVPVAEVQAKSIMSKNMRELKARERKIELQTAETALKADKRYSDFDEYKDEIYEMLETHPNLSLKEAYVLTKASDGLEGLERIAEQRVLAKRAAKSKKGVVKGSGVVTSSKTTRIPADVRKVAEAMGMSPQEYMKYQKITSLSQLENKKKKKG